MLTWMGVAVMILMPVFFYPFSKTLFLAVDLIFRPAGFEPAETGHVGAPNEPPTDRGGN